MSELLILPIILPLIGGAAAVMVRKSARRTFELAFTNAGLLTKFGIYALTRFFTLVFVIDTAYLHFLLLAVAALTMITGVLGAAAQNEFRRILSFLDVAIGYALIAFLGTVALARFLMRSALKKSENPETEEKMKRHE